MILISLDGFRWDYLLRNLTPNMQQLINAGVSAPCTAIDTMVIDTLQT